MSKAGILDPWRQAAPKPPPKKSRQDEFSEDETPERCITFQSGDVGLFVWVDADDAQAANTALNRVKDLLRELQALKQPEVSAALVDNGITGDISSGVLPADAVARAVRRSLVVSNKAAALIARYRVKAFVK